MTDAAHPLALAVVQVELPRELRERLAAQAGLEEKRVDEVLAEILEHPERSMFARSVTEAMDAALLEQVDRFEVGPAVDAAITTETSYELAGVITRWDRETLHAEFLAEVTFVVDGEATRMSYQGTFVFHFAVLGTWAFVQGLRAPRFKFRRR